MAEQDRANGFYGAQDASAWRLQSPGQAFSSQQQPNQPKSYAHQPQQPYPQEPQPQQFQGYTQQPRQFQQQFHQQPQTLAPEVSKRQGSPYSQMDSAPGQSLEQKNKPKRPVVIVTAVLVVILVIVAACGALMWLRAKNAQTTDNVQHQKPAPEASSSPQSTDSKKAEPKKAPEPEIATKVFLSDSSSSWSQVGAGIVQDIQPDPDTGSVSFSYWAPGMSTPQACDLQLWPETGHVDADFGIDIGITSGDNAKVAIFHRITDEASGLEAQVKKYYLTTMDVGSCETSAPVELNELRDNVEEYQYDNGVEIVGFDKDVLAFAFDNARERSYAHIVGIDVSAGKIIWDKKGSITPLHNANAPSPEVRFGKLLRIDESNELESKAVWRVGDGTQVWRVADHTNDGDGGVVNPHALYALTDDSFLCIGTASTGSSSFFSEAEALFEGEGVGVCDASGITRIPKLLFEPSRSTLPLSPTKFGEENIVFAIVGTNVYEGDYHQYDYDSETFGYFDSSGTWTELVDADRWRDLDGKLLGASDGRALIETTAELLWIDTDGETETIGKLEDPLPGYAGTVDLGDTGEWVLWEQEDSTYITKGTEIPPQQ